MARCLKSRAGCARTTTALPANDGPAVLERRRRGRGGAGCWPRARARSAQAASRPSFSPRCISISPTSLKRLNSVVARLRPIRSESASREGESIPTSIIPRIHAPRGPKPNSLVIVSRVSANWRGATPRTERKCAISASLSPLGCGLLFAGRPSEPQVSGHRVGNRQCRGDRHDQSPPRSRHHRFASAALVADDHRTDQIAALDQ